VTAAETDEYNRSNITETQDGLPIQYVLTVTENNVTLSGVRLDMWFANASGIYSGVSAENTLGEDYLRGWQETDENGQAIFYGIFPGPYTGRTLHVHLRVRRYDENGTVIYNNTTQLFFPEDINEEVMQLDAYVEAATQNWNTDNDEDSIFAAENVVTLTGNTTDGYVATYTIELPLTETSASSSDSGAGSGSPPSGGAGGSPPSGSGPGSGSRPSGNPRCLRSGSRSRLLLSQCKENFVVFLKAYF